MNDDVIIRQQDAVCTLTLNRVDKHNAFDDRLIKHLNTLLQSAINDDSVRVIRLAGEGNNFSAGADLHWMQRMAEYSEEENVKDSLELARLMQLLHRCPKPTIACVQGAAMGGGVGLVAACDIAIATQDAHFCFSEVKLGLIPAVISPYVIKAIGARLATRYFVSAERISAQRALQIGLISELCANEDLNQVSMNLALRIAANAPQAVQLSKSLIHTVDKSNIDEQLMRYTAEQIAQKRVSSEGQKGLHAFLSKQKPNWD